MSDAKKPKRATKKTTSTESKPATPSLRAKKSNEDLKVELQAKKLELQKMLTALSDANATKASGRKSHEKAHGKAAETQTHFRRCHLCNETTEGEGADVKTCGACGKSLAPFYFFDDKTVMPHADHDHRPERLEGKVRPVLGFTAYW